MRDVKSKHPDCEEAAGVRVRSGSMTMPTVYIPPALRDLTHGVETVTATGATVRAVLADLEPHYPGLTEKLCVNDALRPGLMVAVGGTMSQRGLRTAVPENAEVHFLPALGGG